MAGTEPHDLIAFPLLALSALVMVAAAIVGGELLRRFVIRPLIHRFGLAHADLDGVAPEKAPGAAAAVEVPADVPND